jgi:Tfp pilus assembly protein PilX
MKERIACSATSPQSGQRGFITLVVSLTILMLSTLVVFNVSNAVLMEQKIYWQPRMLLYKPWGQ